MMAGEPENLLNFGGGNITRKHPADTHTLPMNFEHDLRGLFTTFVKKILQYDDDKIHRRVVIIQQHHLIHRWWLKLGLLYFKYGIVVMLGCHVTGTV